MLDQAHRLLVQSDDAGNKLKIYFLYAHLVSAIMRLCDLLIKIDFLFHERLAVPYFPVEPRGSELR